MYKTLPQKAFSLGVLPDGSVPDEDAVKDESSLSSSSDVA